MTLSSRTLDRLAAFSQTIKPSINQSQLQIRSKSSSSKPKSMESSLSPLSGLYKPNALKALYYGPNTVRDHLKSCLPSDTSKAFIITGSSLASKTPLIKQIEDLLTPSHHAGTFSSIRQHAPIEDLDKATKLVQSDSSIDTIISVGGGSPIDSAKAISYRVNEKSNDKDKWLTHIAIPTTLSAAECTFIAGYTQSDGVKTGISDPNVYPSYILYDPKFALYTPPYLFASTGIRALDHAVETQYHAVSTLMPARWITLVAIRELFEYLPRYHKDPKDEDVITRLFLAAYASLGFFGANMKGGLGLSHTMGYALGSPYGIPHGITSCMTLGHVVKIKAQGDPQDAAAVAGILDALGEKRSGDDVKDATVVGDRILKLVDELGFKTTLTEKGVGRDQVDIILGRATGGLSAKEGKSEKEKEMVGAVRSLIETLY